MCSPLSGWRPFSAAVTSHSSKLDSGPEYLWGHSSGSHPCLLKSDFQWAQKKLEIFGDVVFILWSEHSAEGIIAHGHCHFFPIKAKFTVKCLNYGCIIKLMAVIKYLWYAFFFLAFHWINDNNKNIKGPTFFNKACGLKTLHFSCIRIIVLYV